MKKNQNNLNPSEYYIGLDVGTTSVGYAATDVDYNLKKISGKSMWGVRLFDEGKTAVERRTNRNNRRRLRRTKWRVDLLQELFDTEISKIDIGFFMRLKESSLFEEDKKSGTKYSLFNDATFTDKMYHKRYKTIYHLRKELLDSDKPHDIRLVYLALHHIIKNRGHFLYELEDNETGTDFDVLLDNITSWVQENIGYTIEFTDKAKIHDILSEKRKKKLDKEKEISELLQISYPEEYEEKAVKNSKTSLIKLLIGGTIKPSTLFMNEGYEEVDSFSLDASEDKLAEIANNLGDDFDLIIIAKNINDRIILDGITGAYNYISEYKIAEFNQHHKDIMMLKKYIREELCDKKLYDLVFNNKGKDINNYVSYSKYKKGNEQTNTNQESFCKFLKTKVKDTQNPDYAEMFERINAGTFATKLRTSANGVIPNGLHKKELKTILANAQKYLPFLSQKDENGLSVTDKVVSIFEYRLPYYVGPLNNKSPFAWVIRKDDKIYPWNLNQVVDMEQSAGAFIERMTSKCTYTGDDVLPKDSLLYSEFMVLNEINPIKICDTPISVETKKQIFNDLFVNQNKKITKKTIANYLIANGLMKKGEELSGIDDTIKSSLASYHKFRPIIDKLGKQKVEDIITKSVLFGDDKRLLQNYLRKETTLSADEITYITRIKCKDFGRLSAYFLTGLECSDEQGELHTIMDLLYNTNDNLQMIIFKYPFKVEADKYKAEKYNIVNTPRQAVDNLYVSPKIRRSIWQTLRIVDEIVDIQKSAPKKIFIEVARDINDTNKKEKKVTRKQQLIDLYKKCKQDSTELFETLNNTPETDLRKDALYLYYTQFGKCMYSGEAITNVSDIYNKNLYDIDHIYPRSKLKDDSLDNRVLVKAVLNRDKTNDYPIKEDIRTKMHGFWRMLCDKELISTKKFERLSRANPLTDTELSSFINRQLVETQQSTKALAELLIDLYPGTKIVYSKAGNVSDFRQVNNLTKNRDINDFHHANDAYLNIVVGNFFDTKFTQAFFMHINTSNYTVNPEKMYKFDVPGAWVAGENGTIQTVLNTLAKHNIIYTRMPFEQKGELYNLNILKAPNGQVPIKQNKDINKYGGYNKATGAYFIVVEHTEKKKRLRTIETVMLYQKAEFEMDKIKFMKETMGLVDPVLIVEKLLFDSVLEIDGLRYHIKGRTGIQIVYNNYYQFIVDSDIETNLKNIAKYVTNCASANKELTLYKGDGIDEEILKTTYCYLVDRLSKPPYNVFLNNIYCYFKDNDEFFGKTILEKCQYIMEILKSFKCNDKVPNMKSFGRIRMSNNISQRKSCILINQSPTGLYETKLDLLH